MRNDDLLAIDAGDKWGHISTDGEIVHEPQFDYASSIKGGLGFAKIGDELLIVDRQLNTLGRLKGYDSYSEFSDGLLVVENRGSHKDRYVDRHGRDVFNREFDNAFSFSCGRAFVKIGDDYGLIDAAGKLLIEPSLRYGTPFRPGAQFTSIQRKGCEHCDLIDLDGKVVRRTNYHALRWVDEDAVPFGWLSERGWKFGLADELGNELVPAIYDEIDYGLASGLIGVEVESGLWGVIDRYGIWVIEPRYTYIGSYGDGLLKAYAGGRRNLDRHLLEGKFGFVTREGKIAIDFQFDDAFPFEDGIAIVQWLRPDDEYDLASGYVNTAGRIIWRQT